MHRDATATKATKILRASQILFLISLFLPAYIVDYYGNTKWYFGLGAFVLGPIGLFAGHFSWLANPVLWIAWREKFLHPSHVTLIFSLIAIALASSFLFTSEIAVGSAGNFPYQAHVGFYVWLASMFLTLIAAITSASSKSDE